MPWDMIRAVPLIRRDPLAFLGGLVARHGDLVAFPMPRGTTLLVNDPDGARRVLLDNHRAYGKRTLQYASLSEVTGPGLLTAEADDGWRSHRAVVRPAFHHGALEAVAAHATSVAAQLRAAWDAAPGRLLDADAVIMESMLDLVGRALYATDLGPGGVVDGREIVRTIDGALRLVVTRAASPVPGSWRTPGRARLRRATARLDVAAADVVRARRARGLRDEDGDLLALLLRAQDAGAMTGREVRDELLTMIIAGHETVASSLTWTLHLLARRPEVQEALAAEFDEVLGAAPPGPSHRTPTWADLPALRLTRAVVDEALRLYPPAWVITRRAREPDTLCGVEIPAGTLVLLSPWLLHRRAASWPEPERFDPRRFLDGERSTPRGDYLPFGLGPRLCVGRDTALVEAVLVLATLLPGRRVSPPPGAAAPVAVEALVTLRPHGGLPLTLTLTLTPPQPPP
jgi:cytochrome P450